MTAAPGRIQLSIDGKKMVVPRGTTIWDAAREAGVEIPVLCHEPRLAPVGVCRICVVDVGDRVLAASCVRAVESGMQVETGSEKVLRQRAMLTRLLMSDHPVPCTRQRTTGDCQLEALADRLMPPPSRPGAPAPPGPLPAGNTRPTDLSSPVIAVDHQACILCDRCIRACDDLQVNEVLGRSGKGYTTRISFDLDDPMGRSSCVSCGECAAVCPTGALTDKLLGPSTRAAGETRAVDSVCPYCGVGCALTYHVAGNRILSVAGRDSPGNQRRLCVKGRYGFDYTHHPQRLATPLIRRPEFYPKGPLSADVRGESGGTRRPGILVDDAEFLPAFREASWDEALDLTASRLMEIKNLHGSGALAGFGSAKCSNEEAYLFQKLVRAVFGTNNVDHCTRLCHASSVAALLETIGSGAVTNTFGDVEKAEVVLITGSNTPANHPVAATFIKQAVKKGTRLILVDPRRSDLYPFATHFCRIRPGSDVAFYNAVMHVIIAEDLPDKEFIRRRTENFDALARTVADYSPGRVAPLVGVPAEEITRVARLLGRARTAMVFWGMGISQHTHGTDNARCLISLMLLTGQVGRPGTGLHPLRGQNNVQGASDAGLIPMVYPDYQPVGDPSVRRKFEQAWGVSLNPEPGLTVVEILHAALDGRIRGMMMTGENPFLSDPNINKVRRALSALDFLAVQDIFPTETAEFADVILPATSALEKTGTFTNTDRRVQVGRQALDPPGQARLDWRILCELSTRMGYPMSYDNPEAIFAEFASLTRSYRGLDYNHLLPTGKLWPFPDPEGTDGIQVLFGDTFPSGRGRFVPATFAPARELPDDDYPLVLTTGRLLEHWHTGSMTRRSTALDAIAPDPFVEVHADDARSAGVAKGERVRVSSRRGSIILPIRISDRMELGSVFIPFHFREAAANVLTIDELDPDGKIPEFKFCAVRLDPAAIPDARPAAAAPISPTGTRRSPRK
ncbi:MAG: formate dehydrogenase subunit alpha [Acidobacteriota bacterium]